MRPLETTIVILVAASFLMVGIPYLHTHRGIRTLLFGALFIAVGLHLFVEGARWQMYPTYLLAGVFLMGLIVSLLSPEIHLNKLMKYAGVVLGGFLLILSIVLPLIFPVFRFSVPTGPYGIGTLTYHWMDKSRPELFTKDPNDYREIIAQIWYPTQEKTTTAGSPYVPDAKDVIPEMMRLFGFPPFLMQHLQYVKTHALTGAPVADDRPVFPVLIYLEGLGGVRGTSTFQVEELVSHGYVVVCLDQPGAASLVRFPNGHTIPIGSLKIVQALIDQSICTEEPVPLLNDEVMPEGIIPYFADDAVLALDELKNIHIEDEYDILTGKLDLNNIGVFGISLGAINASELSAKDRRIKACVMMDAAMTQTARKNGLKQPCMWLTRKAEVMRLEREKAGGWTEKDILQTHETIRYVYDHLAEDGYIVSIDGLFHVNFTDAPLWSPILPVIGLTGPLNGKRGHTIINAYTLAFFDKYLKHQSSLLLDGTVGNYPEVTMERKIEQE